MNALRILIVCKGFHTLPEDRIDIVSNPRIARQFHADGGGKIERVREVLVELECLRNNFCDLPLYVGRSADEYPERHLGTHRLVGVLTRFAKIDRRRIELIDEHDLKPRGYLIDRVHAYRPLRPPRIRYLEFPRLPLSDRRAYI